MFKFGGWFFFIIGLFLFFFGVKKLLMSIEYYVYSETVEAVVIDTSYHTNSYRRKEYKVQDIIVQYEVEGEKIVDSLTEGNSGDLIKGRFYQLPSKNIGDICIVRYYPKSHDLWLDAKRIEITTDGNYIRKLFENWHQLLIGFGFMFIGGVFILIFSKFGFKEVSQKTITKDY